jgi:hypothetical protein
MMNLFELEFSEASIIRELCKARVKLAKKRHERQFLHNIRKDRVPAHAITPKNWGAIPLDIFPPRKEWHGFRPQPLKRTQRSSFNVNVDALFQAILKLKRVTPAAPWVKKLNEVISDIQKRALRQKSFKFSRPIIFPAEKNRVRHEYRPLILFQLGDKIIDCLTARYLRESLDELLDDACLAFRCRHEKKSPPTIHDALATILETRSHAHGRDMYVAECDIKGFFDCVSHKVVLDAYNELLSVAGRNNPMFTIDKRATQILKAYLNAYSFSRDIYGNKTTAKQLNEVDPKGTYKWPREDLKKLYGSKKLSRVGIPQGGALSCLIANMVLHKADQAVLNSRAQREQLLYLRYCDDMILIGDSLKRCTLAFSRYKSTLKKLLLPIHVPEVVKGYSTRKLKLAHWNHKSNKPYRWSTPLRGIPWIQFVGYHIRYDGLVRVRPKSIKKEFKKLSKASAEMLRAIAPSRMSMLRKSRRQIRHRFRTRLISMAVGRRVLGPPIKGPLPMCWTNGFRGLLGKTFVNHALKDLDRHRERQVNRIDRALRGLTLPKAATRDRSGALAFYGSPFSYRGQFPTIFGSVSKKAKRPPK